MIGRSLCSVIVGRRCKFTVANFTSPDAVVHYLLNSNRSLKKNFARPQRYLPFCPNLIPIHTKFLYPNIRGASVPSASHVRTSAESADEHQKPVRLQHTALCNAVNSSVVLTAANFKICALLQNYAAHSGNSLPKIRDSLPVPSSQVR
jgi:hypothetical protein